jgi:pSer/pThr/pTyr-binding forkhead associated (FHA) protein
MVDDPPETREIRSRIETFVFRRFRLTVTEGDDAGQERVSDASELAIGTDAGNQLILQDPTVSRHHCAIAASARGFRLRDLGSTNGTFVNRGQRLLPGNRHPLNHGDEIIVGKTFLKFVLN